MSERNMTAASAIRLIERRNDINTAVQGYEAAREALGDCARILDQAEAAILLADTALGAGLFDGVSNAYYFQDDPERHVAAARSALARLQTCLDPMPTDTDGDSEPDADEETPPASPAEGGGWRIAAGLGLVALAAYGLWRMR
ncbi:MAG: hypothetical protein M0R22_00525 [Dehalococcoidia bacterium]|jgi:hypothetical protein|nr:hypothetical protein [Dehalococcoidia bacterium]